MAERRMFAKMIIDSDAFLDMPLSTQTLYFHLSMRADDDGFINSPKRIQRLIGASDDDLKLLIAKNFIIPFESGVVVIKHWRIHNYIQTDRYKETVYTEEKARLGIKPNKAYTLNDQCIQNGYIADTQVRIGKVSKGKDRINNAIDGYTENEELRSALRDFGEMRKLIKKPMTDRAWQNLFNKLSGMGDEEMQIAILNQSIEHCWQTVYPIKDEKPQTANHDWNYDELQKLAERKGL